jgi:hypothetical protein
MGHRLVKFVSNQIMLQFCAVIVVLDSFAV